MDSQGFGSSGLPSVSSKSSPLQDSNGWDGKLRIDKKAVLADTETLSSSDHSDEEIPPTDQIKADEGTLPVKNRKCLLISIGCRSA